MKLMSTGLPVSGIHCHTQGVYHVKLQCAGAITEFEFVGGFEPKAYQNAKSRVCVSIRFQRSGRCHERHKETGIPFEPDEDVLRALIQHCQNQQGTMFLSSFEKTKSFFSENDLQYIAPDICFPNFMTLHVGHFFAGMRTPSRPTPDMREYGSRSPSCMLNLYRRYITLPFQCILDPKVTTRNEQ